MHAGRLKKGAIFFDLIRGLTRARLARAAFDPALDIAPARHHGTPALERGEGASPGRVEEGSG
jgi:hypothetical protein